MVFMANAFRETEAEGPVQAKRQQERPARIEEDYPVLNSLARLSQGMRTTSESVHHSVHDADLHCRAYAHVSRLGLESKPMSERFRQMLNELNKSLEE